MLMKYISRLDCVIASHSDFKHLSVEMILSKYTCCCFIIKTKQQKYRILLTFCVELSHTSHQRGLTYYIAVYNADKVKLVVILRSSSVLDKAVLHF